VHVACIINLVAKTRGKTLLGTYGRSWRRILKPALRVNMGFIQKIEVRRINAVVGNFTSTVIYKMGYIFNGVPTLFWSSRNRNSVCVSRVSEERAASICRV